MGPPDSRGVTRAPRYSGSRLASAELRIRGCHPLRPAFPGRSPRSPHASLAVLQPRRGRNRAGLGSSPVARHYWGNHILFSLPAGTKMFQFPAFASSLDEDGRAPPGRVFAACRAFHRLPEPQASAVRPFLLSPAWTTFTTSRRIPWLILSFSVESRFLLSSLLFQHVNDPVCHIMWQAVENNGFEPLTPCVQSRCSSQLS